MYEFLEYVLWELKNSFGLVFLAGIGALMVLCVVYFIHRKKFGRERKFPWGRAVLYLLLAGYLAIVLYATLLRGVGGYRQVNLHLFRAWREAWNNFSAKNWANVLLNVAMFAPLGFLLPMLHRAFRKWYVMGPVGFAASLTIELLQLAVCRGICDVDDLFANTLGAVMGYLLIMTGLSIPEERGKKRKPSGIYCGLLIILAVSLGGIFVVYDAQEYGNLPNAAAYTNDTGDVEWSMECELPSVGEKAAAYQNQPRSLEECDAFAEEFAKIVGTEFDDITYYQEAAYYMDHGTEDGYHFLFLSYHDTSYEYSCGYLEEDEWANADREALEAALEKYPLMIPEYAQFQVEGDGWHSFTVKQHVDGAVMIDGTLRCRYESDGTIREIQNDLLSYTYYEDVEIIAPEAAFELLCSGKFNDGGLLEHVSPEKVLITSCSLEYEIDTKGFYQPVYYFDAESEDGNYQARIMIPAMK